MANVFETERLIAREWDADRDTEHAFEMYGDPEVMRFLGREPKVVPSIEAQQEWLKLRCEWMAKRVDGTGMWALEEKGNGNIVGTVLIKWLPDAGGAETPDLEIGWHLKKKEWGKGYASEAGKAAARYAFDVLRVPLLYAVVFKENARSIAVTGRLGMTPLGPTDKYYGVTVELFELRAEPQT